MESPICGIGLGKASVLELVKGIGRFHLNLVLNIIIGSQVNDG